MIHLLRPLLLTAALLAPACIDRGPAPEAESPWAHPDMVPFAMTLQGAEDGPDLRLRVELDLRRPLPAPLVLSVELPNGATLVDGAAREVIGKPAQGTMTRELVVRGAAGRTVVVQAKQTLAGQAGAESRLSYPPPAATPPPTWTKIEPHHIGGVPVREAVKITPGER